MGQVLAVQTCKPVFRRHTYVKSGHGSGFLHLSAGKLGKKELTQSVRDPVSQTELREEKEKLNYSIS